MREMRRIKQLLSVEETEDILKRNTNGVLSVQGDDGYPYGVPLSYAYKEGIIVFHCAVEGHKLDALKRNDKVSFTVVDKDEIIPEKYTTYFRSVIVFGKARIIEDEGDIRDAMIRLVKKYSFDYLDGANKEIESQMPKLCVVEIDIEHMTGKAAVELVK